MKEHLIRELLAKRSYFKESYQTIAYRFDVPIELVYEVFKNPLIQQAKKEYNNKPSYNETFSKKVDPEVNKRKEFIKKLVPKNGYLPPSYTSGNLENVLIIPDLHEPATIDGALEFCREQQEKFSCGKVIFLGDLMDAYTLSRFPRNPDFRLSPIEEIEVAKQRISKWYKVFPEATVLTSNHDSRIFQKAMFAQIPTTWLKDIKDILEVPDWEFVPEYEYNGVFYHHGESDTARKVALYKNQSVVGGHRHNECYIEYLKSGIFGMQCGTLVSREHMVFEYARHQVKQWINGVGIILGDQPLLVNFK